MRKAVIALVALVLASRADALEIPFTVKESAGVGATAFPIAVVIPLPDGQYTSTSSFGITDAGGNPVPAQFEVLERDWIEDSSPGDNSILHVVAHFLATVGAAGTAQYRFDDRGNTAPATPATVSDAGGLYTVTTGPIRFTVNKTAFNILDTVWYDADGDGSYESSGGSVKADERIIRPSVDHGGRFDGCTGVGGGSCTREWQHDSGLAPDRVEIEEAGPLRVVLRLERYTDYSGIDDHKHGYVVRIYAYAGKPYVKIDYQLINAATGPALAGGKFSNPLYFNALNLEWKLELGAATVRTSASSAAVDTRPLDANGVELAYTLHDAYSIRQAAGSPSYATCTDATANTTNDCDTAGFMDASDSQWGAQAVVRNMWELWPSGIELGGAAGAARLQVQLWPDWSQQWKYASGTVYGAGLYWLDDMRAVYKEVLLNFHGASPSNTELNAIARTFDRHPVAVVDLAAIKTAGVTYNGRSQTDRTAYAGNAVLETYSATDLTETNTGGYRMGWGRWAVGSIGRLLSPHNTGNGPPSGETFFYAGDPASYWTAEREAIGELNARPQWMGTDYTHGADYSTLALSTRDYPMGTWRAPSDTKGFAIAGTDEPNRPVDDEHAWSYNVWDYYWFSGNPWVRDWLRFVGEIRRGRTTLAELQYTETDRAVGHTLAGTWQAYRATGDTTLLDQLVSYVGDYIQATQLNPKCGHQQGYYQSSNPTAFMLRTLMAVLERLRGNDWDAWAKVFAFVSAEAEWNYHYGTYGYNNVNICSGDCCVNGSSGTAPWNFPDVDAWYYWITGKTRFKTRTDAYIDGGLGSPPYNTPNGTDEAFATASWTGTWASRPYHYVDSTPRSDSTAPTAVGDLTATLSGGILRLNWTPPASGGPAAYYLIAWSDRQLEECTTNCATDAQSTDTTNYRNWWAAAPAGCSAQSCPGSATIDVTGRVTPTRVAVFAFDAADNMSPMSNVAVVGSGPAVPPPTPTGLRVGP